GPPSQGTDADHTVAAQATPAGSGSRFGRYQFSDTCSSSTAVTMRPMPSEQQRKEVALAYCERVTAGDVEKILELFEPDAVIEDPMGTGEVHGREALREY